MIVLGSSILVGIIKVEEDLDRNLVMSKRVSLKFAFSQSSIGRRWREAPDEGPACVSATVQAARPLRGPHPPFGAPCMGRFLSRVLLSFIFVSQVCNIHPRRASFAGRD